MAAATQGSLATSAAVFAGGLAVGIGGVLALSRSSFAPATKLNTSTKQKARNGLSLPKSSADHVVVSTAEDGAGRGAPAGEKLDAVDQKGVGPAAPRTNAPDVVKPLIVDASKRASAKHSTSITGKEVAPEPSAKNRMSDIDTRMDLAQASIRAEDRSAEQAGAAPAWLSGLDETNQLSTSTGLVDKIAFRSSDALFVYESAANGGFGSWSEHTAAKNAEKNVTSGAKVMSMQTRAGAGAAIAGYMSEKGTSSAKAAEATEGSVAGSKIVSALTNADGFLAMAPSLALTDAARDSGRLVLQISASSHEKEEITNSYASVLAAASTISNVAEDFTVVLSGDRQEAVDVAAAVYQPNARGHVAHVFDGAFSGREVAKISTPSAPHPSSAEVSAAEALNAAGFAHFSYEGPSDPTTLIVVPNGSHATAARAVYSRATDDIKQSVGVVSARIVRPWSDAELLKLIKPSVEVVHVIDEVRVAGMPGVLHDDVQASILSNLSAGPTPVVQPVSLHCGETLSAAQWNTLLDAATSSATKWQLDLDAIKSVTAAAAPKLTSGDAQLITFVDSDSSSTAPAGLLFARTFRDRNSDVRSSRIHSRYDNYEAGGLVRSDIVLAPSAAGDAAAAAQVPLPLAAQDNESRTLVIGDAAAVLKGYNIFASLQPGGTVIFNTPGYDGNELAAKLRAEDKRALAEKKARVYAIDATAVVERMLETAAKVEGGMHRLGKAIPKATAAPLLVAATLAKHLDASSSFLTAILSKILGAAPLGPLGAAGLVDAVTAGVQLVAFSTAEWQKSQPVNEAEANLPARLTEFRYNGYGPSADASIVGAEPVPMRATKALPAWQTIFSEAYNTSSTALRPDLPEENWVLTVTENRRLTPLDYDRNVFHMELSTKGTGLKYEVGEALGIHGWNDADEVREFVEWSGYDADEVLSVPSLSDPTRYESRTVYQVLQQRLDIFGKPPKRFYEALSKLATDKDEAKWLRFVSSAEGQSTFKKLTDIETVTYADVLKMFPSARLPLDILMTEVEQIKPRHYSIASAQSFVGDSVHLLIVTVDWRTPSGSPRYGQCTRYLANLKVGEQVTVSLKPSVMKLPPFTKQPIVMSGLGTGAAPFRAYIQARAVQKQQGHEIGPMIYIFGSRYKHAEYLYGEELEAYEKDGLVKVLTAFSRDQKNKIYIQHRIEQHQKEILDLLIPPAGSSEDVQGLFTLCGPTDPLPDVQEALIKGFISKTGKSHADGEAWLEELKEQERAVYEVY